MVSEGALYYMKEKNRFSVLLEHLTSMANLKNYVLAKAIR